MSNYSDIFFIIIIMKGKVLFMALKEDKDIIEEILLKVVEERKNEVYVQTNIDKIVNLLKNLMHINYECDYHLLSSIISDKGTDNERKIYDILWRFSLRNKYINDMIYLSKVKRFHGIKILDFDEFEKYEEDIFKRSQSFIKKCESYIKERFEYLKDYNFFEKMDKVEFIDLIVICCGRYDYDIKDTIYCILEDI